MNLQFIDFQFKQEYILFLNDISIITSMHVRFIKTMPDRYENRNSENETDY